MMLPSRRCARLAPLLIDGGGRWRVDDPRQLSREQQSRQGARPDWRLQRGTAPRAKPAAFESVVSGGKYSLAFAVHRLLHLK